MSTYDYLIVNDDIDASVKRVHEIIQNEHFRITRNDKFIKLIKEELQCFSEGE